jgi:NAD(P)-dependent dehydrogenase (short-subunit alcohol dehydrogenase family)
MKLEDTVVVVTGGASGIGAAVALHFKAKGAKVVVWDSNTDFGTSFASSSGTNFFQCDVTKTESIERALAGTLALYPSIDVLVNCAGVFIPTKTLSPDHSAVSASFLRLFEINVTGSFNCSRLVATQMSRKTPAGGVIILLSSSLAYQAASGQLAYGASKAAIRAMTLAMARDLSTYHIRVNSISPGPIDTPMIKGRRTIQAEKSKNQFLTTALLGRVGRAEEVAHLVAAVAENDYLTGGDLAIDGGVRI